MYRMNIAVRGGMNVANCYRAGLYHGHRGDRVPVPSSARLSAATADPNRRGRRAGRQWLSGRF